MTTLTDEYLDYYIKYSREYGEKTCILMQVGMFYEIESVRNEKECIGNVWEVAEVLHIQVTKKNKGNTSTDRTNPYFGGFPIHALPKFLPILLENGYTVVVIDQIAGGGASNGSTTRGNAKRKVTGVYSPSIYPIDMGGGGCEGNNLTTVLLEFTPASALSSVVCGISVSNINLTNNTFYLHESYVTVDEHSSNDVIDSIYKMMIRYASNEVCIHVVGGEGLRAFSKESLVQSLDLMNVPVKYTAYTTDEFRKSGGGGGVDYQNTFLKRVYSTHVNFGLLSPIEYFDLERYPLSITNVVLTLGFVSRHDMKYIQNISPPQYVTEHHHLVLEMNTLQQLNVVGRDNTSLFDVIDRTSTSIGRRELKALLCKPFIDPAVIRDRLDMTRTLVDPECQSFRLDIRRELSELVDFERLHRRMSLGVLQPAEFYQLHVCYGRVLALVECVGALGALGTGTSVFSKYNLHDDHVSLIKDYMATYTSIFDIERMSRTTLGDLDISTGHFFNPGQCPEIEKIYNSMSAIDNKLQEARDSLGAGAGGAVKVCYSEMDGYHFVTTNVRCQVLLGKLNEDERQRLTVKRNSSSCKIWTEESKRWSMQLVKWKETFSQKVKLHYTKHIVELYERYHAVFKPMRDFVALLDITLSNAKCAEKYNYCCPDIIDVDVDADGTRDSSVYAVGIRHPIIERIKTDTMYVPNDVKFDGGSPGMILYALNACGKSSLLRSIGLCVIMAQCGLYVPCTTFRLVPFKTILTQVDLSDNLWRGQSSFVTEMIGLKKIMALADRNALVLSDELTKGTEVVSATAIFTAVVKELTRRGSKFLFTTHLGDVAKMDAIRSDSRIQICHLAVDICDSGKITFRRTLQPGPCSELYGLEVAKAIGLDRDLMEDAFNIRGRLVGVGGDVEASGVSHKKSRYNRKKILERCEICSYTPTKPTDIPLDTHHIQFQCTADSNNFNGHFHKNSAFNLVCLCKACHIRVHNNEIKICGYIQTTDGVTLDYTFLK
jgi:DNA mismatch repair protein MutS